MPELVVDKGEKESRGNNFSLKFHFALVEEHPLDIHAAIRIIANFFALDVSHNKPREYVFSVTLTRYGQWTTNEKNIYIFFFLFSFSSTRSFSWIFHDARWKIYARSWKHAVVKFSMLFVRVDGVILHKRTNIGGIKVFSELRINFEFVSTFFLFLFLVCCIDRTRFIDSLTNL